MRALKLSAVTGAAIFCLALLAAWQVPPRLDWNKYRTTIAAFASARMGRRVTIGGQVRLLLLPDVVLVADKVRLADRGDGVSATIGALRLRVSFGRLLQGRVVPRRLELDDPVVQLPWPLPRGAAQAVPTRVAGGFTASVEGGSVHLGGVLISGINAAVQTDPDTGAFAAQGAATLGGLPCRFTSLIGAPAADGVSLLTLTVDGQGKAQGAGGTLRGRMQAAGSVAGDLALRGGDLSRLLPGPPVPWRVQGAVTANETEVRAPKLELMLADSPGDGSAALHLGDAPSLDVTASVGQVKLDGWGWKAVEAAPALAVHIDLSATAAALMGGTVRDARAVVSLGRDGSEVKLQGVLPGATAFHLDGKAHGQSGDFAGRFALTTPDAPVLLAWMRPLAQAVFDQFPAPPAQADFAGDLALRDGTASLTKVSGHVGASNVSFSAALTQGVRPVVAASVVTDRLLWPAFKLPGWWSAAQSLGTLAAPFDGFDATVSLDAASVIAAGATASHVSIQATGGREGLSIGHASADLAGAHVQLSGSVGHDGSLADMRLDLSSADAASVQVPVKLPPGLWQGPLHLAVSAAGPPQAIAWQLRGDLGDLRAEAEAHLNTQAPLFNATVTLRHPGAPWLLDQAGLHGTGAWLGQGSVAFLAHVTAAPGQVVASDFSLGAGTLRAGGQLSADFSGAQPLVTGRVDAPVLTLPPMAASAEAALPLGWLGGWQGQIQLSARQVLAGLWPVAANAMASLTVADQDVLLDGVGMDVTGGRFTGQAAVDAAVALPVFALSGTLAKADIDQLPALPGLVFHGGSVDLDAAVDASGHSAAALLATASGHATGAVTGAALQGIDLSGLARLLLARGPRLRAGLAAGLSSGSSGPLSGRFDATLDHGGLAIGGADFSGDAGSVTVSGAIDLPERSPDLLLRALPAVPKPPVLPVRVLGGKRVVNAQPGMAWAGRK